MGHHNTVFSQFLKLVPRHDFDALATIHHAGAPLRRMTRYSQFVALATGHLAKRHSLRDIVANLGAQASRLGVGISTAGHWFRRYRDHGETAARKQGQPKGSKLDAHEGFIFGLVDETPDITLDEIAERLASEFGVSACRATVWHFFDKRGITFKKRPPMRASSNAPM